MVRKVNMVGGDRDPRPSAVPKTKPKGKKVSEAVFRTPHPELEVIVVPGDRIDQGAGNYSIVPPKTVVFENYGNYGQVKVDLETAEQLRTVAKERENRGLPPKFVEV